MPRAGYNRANRVADQIRMEVAEIIMRKTKDPRLGAVTVTDVELTADLRQAHIYYTSFPTQTDAQRQDVQSGLARASGFIRSELGRRLHLRYTPELMFHEDLSGPKGDRILTILEKLDIPSGNGSESEESPEGSTGPRNDDAGEDD
jgi:ribosome-binding factor A